MLLPIFGLTIDFQVLTKHDSESTNLEFNTRLIIQQHSLLQKQTVFHRRYLQIVIFYNSLTVVNINCLTKHTTRDIYLLNPILIAN